MIVRATDFDLRSRNTFGLPCIAAQWVEYSSREDIPAVAAMLDGDVPHLLLGGGSNILFTSPVYPGIVAHSNILTLDAEVLGGGRVRVTAGSGITMDSLVERTCSSGLWGMENLSLIPGEVGASAVQNVGAYGCEAADLIEKVEAFDTVAHRFVTFTAAECDFAYRHSMFKTAESKGRYIIAAVSFILSSKPSPRLDYGNLAAAFADGRDITPMAVREEVITTRNAKLPDPAVTGSAGSYFTNPQVPLAVFEVVKAKAETMFGPEVKVPHFILPDGRVKIPAAWLIDRAGLKGAVEGGAGLWPTQPLVIANLSGNCTAADVIALEQRVVSTVQATFGVHLVPEVEKAPPLI